MRFFLLGLALTFMLAAAPADAARGGERFMRGPDSPADVQPLKRILGSVRGRFPGEVLDVSLFERNGAWFYQIKILGPDSRVVELIVDARTAQVVSQR